MKRDAERTTVVAVAIRVVVKLQPERECRHKQGKDEGEPQTQSLMGECCSHLRWRIFYRGPGGTDVSRTRSSLRGSPRIRRGNGRRRTSPNGPSGSA